MTGSAPARIFISYARKDGANAAATLRKDLEAEHFSVWHDIVALESGRDWWSQIDEALRSKALHHLVLVLTPGALESKIVRDEIRLARQEGKTVSAVKGPGLGDLSALPRWLGQVYDLDLIEHRNTLMRVLAGPSKAPRVPMMAPEPPADFVQRPREFGALKAKLLDAKGDAVAITAALRGAGGYGKTTLARALAHDPDIVDGYFDGILWVELGEKPGNLLSIISDLIEILTGERSGLENLNSAAAKLGEALGDRRILLILDDAWRVQDLRPFSQGGRNTTRLITTRRDDILPLEAARQPVDAMQAGEALTLLAWGLPPGQAAAQKPALEALAARLGEWAQLLKLVNGFLRDRVLKARQPLDRAIAGVNKRLDEKGLRAFDAQNEARRSNAVAITIGVSLDLLSESERARFAELAVFPEDVDVPIGIAARLWAKTAGLDEAETEDLLVRFESLSLLLSLDLERRIFRFHDTTRHFLQEQAGKDALNALHETLLQAIEGIATAQADEASRCYYYMHFPSHLAAAGKRGYLDELLENPGWLQAKLDALGSPHALISDYEQFGSGRLQDLIRRSLRLSSGICSQDKRQLLPQLHGRLLSEHQASRFIALARQFVSRPALMTTRQSLTLPGAELARLDGRSIWPTSLAVLPDGSLASGFLGDPIVLWDLQTGAELARLEGHKEGVNALASIPGGRLASGAGDKTIKLWDLETRKELARLEGHEGAVNALAVLPGGLLASGAADAAIRIWDVKSGRQQSLIEGHGEGVNALSALPDGRLASGSYDRTIRIWNAKAGAELARLKGDYGRVYALAILPDNRLASGGDDGTVRLWDTRSFVEMAKLEGHGATVCAIAPLPDGGLASGGEDGTIRLWDARAPVRATQPKGHGSQINAITLLPGGRLASGSGDFSRRDHSIRLWDLRTGAEVVKVEGHHGAVNALAMLQDGRLASGSDDATIRLWDLRTGAELAKLRGYGEVSALAVLGDGRLASGFRGSDDTTIRLWDAKTGNELARLGGHSRGASALAVLPDGRLASANGATIRLWDVETGAESGRLIGHSATVNALAVLRDGRLASGSTDATIRLWDVKTGAELLRLSGAVRASIVNALVALPGGRLASGSGSIAGRDYNIRIWDVTHAEELARLEVDAPVLCLCGLPDGCLIAGDALGRLHWLEILD